MVNTDDLSPPLQCLVTIPFWIKKLLFCLSGKSEKGSYMAYVAWDFQSPSRLLIWAILVCQLLLLLPSSISSFLPSA